MAGSGLSLQWPTDVGRITTPFSNASGSVSIAAPTGTTVKAGAAGKVLSASGNSVQVVTSGHLIIYGNLKNLKVQAGQDVATGAALGDSAGPDSITLSVAQYIDPTPALPKQAAQPQAPASPQPSTPTPAPPSGTKLYVTPTDQDVRLRERPVDGKVLMTADPGDVLEVIEAVDAGRSKIGVKDQWINVKTLWGQAGFMAGQFVKEYTGPIPEPVKPVDALNVTGMNLDMYNPLGRPSPDRLKGIGWIRVKFNVSYNPDNNTYGNTDIQATFNRVKPFIEPYAKAGIKVLMVFTHQLYGEGAGFSWPSMNTGTWNQLIPKYADFARQVAQKFAGSGLVHCYQIWNEQDTNPAVARAAVPIPARDYANMLTQTIRAIRGADKTTPIITGGHVGGPDSGGAYARETLAAMPGDVRPDGIASHPYGRGVAGHKFSPFGPLDEEIRKYAAVLPGKPIWFTEWGVLDFQDNMSVVGDVADYATGFMNIAKKQFAGTVAAAIWYAWADGMDNGYGLVGRNDQPKQPLYSKFLGF